VSQDQLTTVGEMIGAIDQKDAERLRSVVGAERAEQIEKGFALGQLGAPFADVRWEVLRQWDAEDSCATQLRIRGVHQGDFMGVPATGREINIKAFLICDFDQQGSIRGMKLMLDGLKLHRQLTAEAPAPTAAV